MYVCVLTNCGETMLSCDLQLAVAVKGVSWRGGI